MPSQTRSVCMPRSSISRRMPSGKGGEAGPWAYVRGNALMPMHQWRCIVQTNQGYGHVTNETQPSSEARSQTRGEEAMLLTQPCRRPW